MRYYIDTEFNEYKAGFIKKYDTIELISIGIVDENDNELYLVSNDFNIKKAWDNDFLRENVLYPIFLENVNGIPEDFSYSTMKWLIDNIGISKEEIKEEVLKFIKSDAPEFWAYYGSYDWVVFCWLFGRMVDLPSNFPMYCNDLKQSFDEVCNGNNAMCKYWMDIFNESHKHENEHNALADAKWNKVFHGFLESIK